jgi:hypothetical protein
MCDQDCCSEAEGITIPTGQDGADGNDGNDGIYGGYSSDWLFETNTGSGPGSTFLRFNHATLASVTTIYINETNASSTDLSGFLATFNNAGDFGVIRVFSKTNSNIFWSGTITSFTDSGSYVTLGVTHASSNGTFTASMPIVVTFSPRGTDGSNGTDGVDGTSLLYSDSTQTTISNNSPGYTNGHTTTITANELNVNGDRIKWVSLFTKTTTGYTYGAKLVIDNNSVTNPIYTVSVPAQYKAGRFEVEIQRTSSTTAYLYVSLYAMNSLNAPIAVYAKQTRAVPIVFAQSITLSTQYNTNNAAASFYSEEMFVEKYNA